VFCVLILEGVVGIRCPVVLVNGFKAHLCFEDSDGHIKDCFLFYPIWGLGGPSYLGLELAKHNVCCYGPLVGIYYHICSSEELMSFLSCFVDVSGLRHLDGVISKGSWEQPNQDGFKVRKLDLCHGS
jgi:hypothetical protein